MSGGRTAAVGLPRSPGGLPRSRLLAGLALDVVGLPVVTAVLVELRGQVARESVLLVFMLCVVAVALVGGWLPAVVSAVAAFGPAKWFLTPPYNTFAVRSRSAFLDLVVFLLGAVVVSVAVEVGARHRAAAERNRLEAGLVARFSSAEMASATVEQVLAQVLALFGMRTVTLVEDGHGAVASVGPPPEGAPALSVPAGEGLVLTAYGPEMFAEDRRLLGVLASSAGQAHQRHRLATEAAQLEQTDRVRSALLAAVSHDLRTPIAGIKAAASGLRTPGVVWDEGEEEELLEAIETGADHLDDLVGNLLAMSRLEAGALSVRLAPVALDEAVSRALLSTGASDVVVDVPDDLPLASADAGLLERVVANCVANARHWSPSAGSVRVVGREHRGCLTLSIIDHGPGIDPARWSQMFDPFQRLGDSSAGGVGLGLAIARGFTEAMGGRLEPAQSDGGGLTLTLSLPRADDR